MLLAPFMKKTEIDYIRPMITKVRYDSLIEAMRDGEPSEEQVEIKRLTLAPVVMKAMAKGLKLVPAELLPDVFARRFTDDKRSDIDTDSRLGAAQVLEMEANRELLKLQRYIKIITPVAEDEILEETDITKKYFLS